MSKDNYILFLLGLPKTIYFNLKYFKLKEAIKLPVFVSHKVKLLKLDGLIIINASIRPGMIKLGFGGVGIFDKKYSRTIYQVSGKIVFNGSANIGHGSKISVNKSGKLILGDNFRISAESTIVCNKKIVFGDNCLLSWNILIMDTDFHKIISNGKITNLNKEIIIGEHVWIGCRCLILKGTNIPNNSIISANTNIYKSFTKQSTVIGGNPPRAIKENIEWIE